MASRTITRSEYRRRLAGQCASDISDGNDEMNVSVLLKSALQKMSLAAFLAVGMTLLLSGCGDTKTPENRTIVVYSPHGPELEGDIKKRFEAAHPEYTVNFLDMGGGEILTRLRAEAQQPRADVWWGGSPPEFSRAIDAMLLEKYTPDWAAQVPADSKNPDGWWIGTFRTPEVIMYNTDKLKREEVPTTWEGMLDPKWKGKIAVRDVRGSATMKTIFCALILREQQRTGNVDAGFDFLKKLDTNTGSAYVAGPEFLYKALTGGQSSLTLWNLADALLQKRNGYPFAYVVPKDAIVPVEPIALVKGGPNPAGAKAFFDFVNSPEQLLLMAQERDRLPVRSDIPVDKLPEWIRNLKLEPMKIDWTTLDKNMEKWIARWDAEIKGKAQ